MRDSIKLIVFWLLITPLGLLAEISQADLSLELRKNLCLTSSPIFDESSSQSFFDFLDKHVQIKPFYACSEYLNNGGKDFKAIELMLQSHILLLRWPYNGFEDYIDEEFREDHRKSILDLAKENQEKSLWANAVIVFEDSDNDAIKKSQMRMIDQDFVLLPYLLLDPELNITQSYNQETRDQIGLNTKNAFARYYYVDYLQDSSLFPFTNEQLNDLIENDEMIPLHHHIAERFYENGDENLGLLHTYLRGIRGNDIDKLYSAILALQNSSQYWVGGLASKLLFSIEDIDSIRADEELHKALSEAFIMITGNPSYKAPNFYKASGTFDISNTRVLFDDYLRKYPDSNLENIPNDLTIRIDEELAKLGNLFEKYVSPKNLSAEEKQMAGSILIKEGDTRVGLDLLIIAANDGNVNAFKGLASAFQFLDTQEREESYLFLRQQFLEGNRTAEFILSIPCNILLGSAASKGIHYPVPEHVKIIDSIVDCNDLSKKSDLMQLNQTIYKIINEDYRLSNREIRNIKFLRDSHPIYEHDANEVLYFHYWRNDKKKALELAEMIKEPEYFSFPELIRLFAEAGKTKQAFNIFIKQVLQNSFESDWPYIIEDYGTPEILEEMILGSQSLWRNIAAIEGEGYALVNTIFSDLANRQLDQDIEEKIYRYDLIRQSIQAMNDYTYYESRARFSLDIGDTASFFAYKDALENICNIEEHDRCTKLKVLDLLADAILNNQDSLKLKMSELTNRFQQDPKYIETNEQLFGYWVYLVADNHLFELEDQYLEILKKLTKSADWDFTKGLSTLANYAYLSFRNEHCRGYDDIIGLFDLLKTDYSDNYFTADNEAFEAFSMLLLWSESCEKLDGSFFSLEPITVELFIRWLSIRDYGLAARTVTFFAEGKNKEFALYLGFELLNTLKNDVSESILLGENPYLASQSKSRVFLQFFTDFLSEEYVNQRIDESTYNEAILEISVLSGFSSITQSLIQQSAIDQINSDSLENSLAELREIRSDLERARENIIIIDGETRDRLLLNLSKSKNIIRDEYTNFGSLDLFPSDLLKVIQAGLKTDEVIILFIDGNESRYTLQITKEDLEISVNNRSNYPDWRSLKKELSQYNQRDLINKEFITYSDLLLTEALPSDIETIIFVSSPELLGFPFKALTLPQTVTVNVMEIASENRFLIQNYNITSAFSVLETVQITNMPSNEGNVFSSLLAFANPAISEVETDAYDFNLDTYRSATSIKEAINYLAPLPESEDEVRAISDYFKDSVIYTGSNATANKFFSEDLSNFSHIIFATHALKPNEIEGIMTSAIVLTPSKEDLGLITPAMVSGLDLSSQHISLSACSTSAPELINGEIYSGFVKSFIEAGAGSVFFTEWEVETNSATFINEGTYRYMSQGHSSNIALTKAIRDFLSTEDNRSIHPSFWAPFQILSNE